MSITPPRTCMVVGSGPAGLSAALALAEVGAEVVLVGPPAPPQQAADTRTAALFTGSVAMLANLGVWPSVQDVSAPLRAIRIIDDTGRLMRAPEVLFEAHEIGLEAFGWNVPNAALTDALWAAVKSHAAIRIVATARVEGLQITQDGVRARTLEGTEVTARLVAAADGRNSICRTAAGITITAWSYDQTAIATRFSHGRPHDDISTEFHRSAGPLTTVPLPGLASSLVWVERPAVAQELIGMDEDAFRHALTERLQGLLARIDDIGPRRSFPLSGLTADTFAANRVALIGEAGHVIPPIGAQGLNLGLRDAAALADCVSEALRQDRDVGGDACMQHFHDARRADVGSRSFAVDTLNRTLLSTLLPVSLVRGLGLHMIRSVGPLKRALIRYGLEPSGSRPTLMQSDQAAHRG